jgi:hypothetical protein
VLKTRTLFQSFAYRFVFFGAALSAAAQTPATILQLQEFLTSKHAAKESDSGLADRLASVTLSEQLTAKTLSRILTNPYVGPKAAEQLELLAAESIFNPPPPAGLPQIPAPDPGAQQKMLASAVQYVAVTLHRLPDFLATRITCNFANTPIQSRPKSSKLKVTTHFVAEFKHEIAYRDGREIAVSLDANSPIAASSLTTWGEFGPVLKAVLDDSFIGSVVWSRWQISESGTQVAVFRFAVPQSASHYLVDFCCYQESKDDPEEYPFRDKPAYHGDLYLDPTTGAIDRITLQADLTEADPVTASAIAVQYGQVDISGKNYVCPTRSVAITEVHNLAMESSDKVGLEKRINIVRFLNYHKFGSTSRIIPK